MKIAPESLSLSPERGFRFVGGSPAVDFVNTVVWTDPGLIHERLPDYDSLVRWAAAAELVPAGTARALAGAARSAPSRAAEAYQKARALRWTLRLVFLGVLERRLSEHSLAVLDAFVREAATRRRLGSGEEQGPEPARWVWHAADDAFELPLWPVSLAAADLLTSADGQRLRMCAGSTCGWMFIDRSRNGLRRWCEMRTCGTAEKSLRRAMRRRRRRSETAGAS